MRMGLLIVGCLLGLILLVVVVVASVGALLPKRHVVSRTASFKAAPDRLFALIAGSQNWRPDVAHSERTTDASGRELLHETARNGTTMTYEISDCVPPEKLMRTIADRNLPYSGSWTYVLTAQGSGTLVKITEDGEVYNPIFRFMSRFVLGQTSTMDAYLRALGKATGEEFQVQ